MLTRRLSFLAILPFLLPWVTPAKDWEGCLGGVGKQALTINGVSIQVFRHPRADQEDLLDECMSEVKDSTGRLVFSAHDHGLEINPVTGTDINGDGEPDAVVEGYSGGGHCCWTYWIVSLGRSPRLLTRFYNERGVLFEKTANHAGTTLATLDGRFDYFDDVCHACSPFPSVYLRLEGDHLVDVSREYEQELRKQIMTAHSELSANELDGFRSEWKKHQTNDRNPFEETRQKVLIIVLSLLNAGQDSQAWKTLGEMWPPNDMLRIKRLILKTRGKGFVAWAQDASNFDD